jgi:hypothetical protein
MSIEQRYQREQCASTDLDLIVHVELRRDGLDHPQRHLQRLAVRMSHGHCEVGSPRPCNDFETPVMQRVKRVVHRHTRRHGIQSACR